MDDFGVQSPDIGNFWQLFDNFQNFEHNLTVNRYI